MRPRRSARRAAATRPGLQGDGTDLALFETEDIGRSDVLVSVIDNDEKNLLASLLGRQIGVTRIITRVSKPGNLRLFERVGVDVAISARGAAIASVLHHIEGGQASLLAVLEEGEGRILEFGVPSASVGKTAPRPRAATRQHHRCDPAQERRDRSARHRCPRRPATACSYSRRVPRPNRFAPSSSAAANAMRLPIVVHLIGVLVRLFGPMLLVPAAVAVYYGEWSDALGFVARAVARSPWGMPCDMAGGAAARARGGTASDESKG